MNLYFYEFLVLKSSLEHPIFIVYIMCICEDCRLDVNFHSVMPGLLSFNGKR